MNGRMDECAMQPKAKAKAKAQIIENVPLGFCGIGAVIIVIANLPVWCLCMYVRMDIRR